MLKSKSLQIQKLRNILKNEIKENIIDIFIIGSSLKNKIMPRDLDIIVMFREKDLKNAEEKLFEIKEKGDIPKIHIEPVFADDILAENIALTIMHEGFSIKRNKFLSEFIKIKPYSIFSFNLENLSRVDKVRFAQSLYGRKKDGLLYSESGISLGHGSFMTPVEKEEIFKELMKTWKIDYKYKKAFVSD